MRGTLYGVSVGPGDPELMTLKAVRVIRQCGVVAAPRSSGKGGPVALDIAGRAVPELREKRVAELSMPMTRDARTLEKMRTLAAETLAGFLRDGEDVAFLTIGDVSIYSTYLPVQERVRAMGFPAEMVAGVPSFCAAAARLGVGLTGDPSKPLHIVPGSYAGVEEALGWSGAKVLMKTGKSLEAVKELLRAHGQYERTQMVQRCGLEGERVFRSLDEADDAAEYLSLMIVPED